MEKHSLKKARRTPRSKRTDVACVLPDGVVILKSPGRATHFTDKEVAAAVKKVLAAREQRLNAPKPGKAS